MTYIEIYRAALEAAAKVAEGAVGRRHICSSCGLSPQEETDRRGRWALADRVTATIRALPAPKDARDMVLVPKEPTEAMIIAGIAERHMSDVPEAWSKATENIYRAMLEARPTREFLED
jgi:hypothetical protein